MADEIFEIIHKLIESLFILLDGRPAWESIRNVFGPGGDNAGNQFVPSVLFFAISFLLGLSGFLLFLILVRRGEKRRKDLAQKALFTSEETK